ncbi:MAG: O-antigen ligase family protein [Candidatus Moraniibacteriota bacterium]
MEQNTPHPNPLLIKERVQNVPRGTIKTPFSLIRRRIGGEVEGSKTAWLFFNIIILSGLFQAIVGIIQFFLQKSIGLFWLRESLISPDILGVAKVILNGEKYIRAYGLMPHPNILGGFLLFSIIINLLYSKLFHVEQFSNAHHPNPLLIKERVAQNVPRPPAGEAGGTIETPFFFIRRRAGDEVYYRWIFRLVLAIKILALILTFSKSAIIGLLIALVYIFTPFSLLRRRAGDEVYDCSTPACRRGRWNNSQMHLTQTLSLLRRWWLMMFHVEQNTLHPNHLLVKEREQIVPRGTIRHLKLIILSVSIILTSIFIIIKPNINSLFLNSLNERLFYLNVPRGTFESDPVFGLGAGQSVLSMQKYFPQKLEFWQYQPVHNVFLLIFSELGLIGLGLFIWWLWKLLHACPPEKCSTWNIFGRVEQSTPHSNLLLIKEKELTPLSFIRRGAGGEVAGSQNEVNNNDYILHNDNIYLSSIIISRYFGGILLGFIFIMLFDHYLWDIQQGSLLFWLTAGFVAGISRK